MLQQFEFLGTRVYLPAALALVGLGVWMVLIGPWSFTQFWVLAGLAMFLYPSLSGILYLTPHLAKVNQFAATERLASPGVEQGIHGLFVVSRIELTLLVLIVADMVIKPFS